MMTTAAMVKYAYDRMDQVRVQFNAVSNKIDVRESRKSSSESRVRIPLKPLGTEPTVDSLGDCLPSRLKHHVVAHVGEELDFSVIRRPMSRAILCPHTTSSASSASNGVVMRSGRTCLIAISTNSAW